MYIKCSKCEFNVLNSEAKCTYCGWSITTVSKKNYGTGIFKNYINFNQDNLLNKSEENLTYSIVWVQDTFSNQIAPWLKATFLGGFLSLFITMFVVGMITKNTYILFPAYLFFTLISTLYFKTEQNKFIERKEGYSEYSKRLKANEERKKLTEQTSIRNRKRLTNPNNSKDENRKMVLHNSPRWTLHGKKEIAQKRIEELAKRKATINSIHSKINKNNDPDSKPILEKLKSGIEIIDTQIEEYKLQQQKIKLINVQNKLVPLLNEFLDLNLDEIRLGLDVCEKSQKIIRDIEKENIRIFKRLTSEHKTLINLNGQIKVTKITIKNLKKSLLHRKALLALSGIKLNDNTLETTESIDLSHKIETFGAKSTLMNFSESFDELETEYKLLQAEDPVKKRID